MPGDGSTYRAPEACPLCAGELAEVQVSNRGDGYGLLVKAFVPRKLFARRTEVEGLACRVCGHLLLFLAEPEILDSPPPRGRRKRAE